MSLHTRGRSLRDRLPLPLGPARPSVWFASRHRGASGLSRLFLRCALEEAGQDVVEYALLGAFIGLASAAALSLVSSNLAVSYTTWDSDVQNLWDMPAPTGS